MFRIKLLVLILAGLDACSGAFDQEHLPTHELKRRQGPGSEYTTSCPHTFERIRPFNLYDSHHIWVKVDQRSTGQFFYSAVCVNNTGPPECPSCCMGTDTARYNTQCKTIQGLQQARICQNRWCSVLSRRWVYIDTGCACYYEHRQRGK
ncbi:hypothetical protein BsWGS_05646 [Bradybaena similaris]